MEFICRSMNVKNIFLLRFENEAYTMGRVYIYDLEKKKASKHVHIQTDPIYLKVFDDRHLYYQNQINVNEIQYVNEYEYYHIQATMQHLSLIHIQMGRRDRYYAAASGADLHHSIFSCKYLYICSGFNLYRAAVPYFYTCLLSKNGMD